MLRFAEDVTLLLEDTFNAINQILVEEIKLKINKILVCIKKEQTRQKCIKIDQENLEEIKSRIAHAKMGYISNQKLLCSSSLENRKMLLKTYVWMWYMDN